jgi:hypothetical protein
MPVKLSVTQRSALAGVAAAALLIASFLLGAGRGSAAAGAPAAPAAPGAAGARITVTGTGSGSGTPDQLTLSTGVQTSGGSVASALQRANRAVRAVTAALGRAGVRAADVQTSGLSIQPQYASNSPVPGSYGVSESIQITLRDLSAAGSQISAAVRAGGNAIVVDGVSLSMNDTSALLSTARVRAVQNAKVKATQEARALGQALGPVVSVSEAAPAQPLPEFPMASAGSRSSVPVSPGTQQLSVTVTVVFALA